LNVRLLPLFPQSKQTKRDAMEIITTNQGQVCTIVNVAATPIVVSRKVGDELQLEGKDFVITDFEDFCIMVRA